MLGHFKCKLQLKSVSSVILDIKSFSGSIQARQVKYERSDEFLGMLKAGPVNKFLRFRYILRKNDQTEVANMLSEYTSHSRRCSLS